MLLRNRKFAIALMLLTLSGCTDAVVWLTKEDASWSFIQARCQFRLGEIETTATQISIPLQVWDQYDSGVCMYDAKGRVAEHRIEVTFRKGLCSGGAFVPLVARVSRPRPGDYQIVYGDPAAGYPVIDSLHVD